MPMVANQYPAGWHDVVRRHYAKTAGYVVAQTGDCLNVQSDETLGPQTRVPGRAFRAMPPTQLAGLSPPKSWFMGIVLCPDDDLRPIVQWFAKLDAADRDRVMLYIHPDVDEHGARVVWEAIGAPAPRTTPFSGSWTIFHHLYGNDFSWRVFQDHGAGKP